MKPTKALKKKLLKTVTTLAGLQGLKSLPTIDRQPIHWDDHSAE